MKVIGLTGGIASGKSTVSGILKSLGALIIDADKVAREVVEPGQRALKEIVKEFGRDVLKEDGTLDRKLLGKIVFSQKSSLEKLNKITHPEICRIIKERIDDAKRAQLYDVVIVDAAILLESGMDKLVDEVWLVYVDRAIQMKRLMERDNITKSEAEDRINSQMPIEEKLKRSHRVIDNRGHIEETKAQVMRLWDRIMNN